MLEYDKNVVGDDRVKFDVLASTPPHPLSPYGETVFGYNTLKISIRQVWADKDIVVVPGNFWVWYFLYSLAPKT